VPEHRLREANRLAGQALEAGTQRQMLTLDLVQLELAYRVLGSG
jgi:hypothetical protein